MWRKNAFAKELRGRPEKDGLWASLPGLATASGSCCGVCGVRVDTGLLPQIPRLLLDSREVTSYGFDSMPGL